MTMRRCAGLFAAAAVAACTFVSAASTDEAWPQRPVTIVVKASGVHIA